MALFTPAVIEVTHENAVVEAGLRRILGAWPEFEVRGAKGASGFTAPTGDPDVIVLDHASGIQWAKNLQRHPRTSIMVVSMTGQETDVRSALAAGVRGYVLIDCSADDIVNAARALAAGRRHLCTAATLLMADSLAQPTLTMRESEVLALVFRGNNNKEVARALDISVGTVKSHVRGLLMKLGARCRTEALWIASQRGLIARPMDAVADLSAMSRQSSSDGSSAALRVTATRPRTLPTLGALQVSAAWGLRRAG
ncbi:MAG TPA: response regulator transcription factor [Ideonella sp.]|uniref:response regulator transcription factor n=1 Tax=Ideonella sp. TaxID=1929293 RepID=UPI002CED0657|nr:response regulator transcription factor [Ideonella sp.]HSI49487.1 response regulator transcription factor [Ideonella sp.]